MTARRSKRSRSETRHTVELGGRCNNNCIFCHANIDRPGRSLEEITSQVALAYKSGPRSFHFSGGELTIRKDLGGFLDFMRRAGLPWSLSTNGRFFSVAANVKPFISAGLDRVTVSLHGPAELHNRITGTDSFEQTTTGIRNLLDSGIEVGLSTVLTRNLVEECLPHDFAAVCMGLDVESIALTPPKLAPSLMERTKEIVPALRGLVGWLADFSVAVGETLRLNVARVPHCALPEGLRTAATSREPAPAWPCRGCSRGASCPGFDIGRWPAASIDVLRPDSRSHPGHLLYRPGRKLADFALESCPYRQKRRSLPCGHEGLILVDKGAARLFKLEGPAATPVLTEAKLNHGQVWLARGDTEAVPLFLAEECSRCHRLFECPTCFVPRVRTRCDSDESAPPDIRRPRRLAADFIDLVVSQAQEGPVTLSEPVREVWLVQRDSTVPERAQPSDPVLLMRELFDRGLVPLSYILPAPTNRGPFRATVMARKKVPDRFFSQHHEGVSLQVTESCMCRCVMCNIVGYFKTPMMSFPRILRALEEAGLVGIRLVDLFGGEVTLRSDLFELIRHVRWLGMDCMFITTGYYLTRKYVRRLKEAGVNRVVVSIDGSRPEIHDAVRQLRGIYDRAVRALKVLAAEPAIQTFSSTVILSENLWDLPDLIRLSGRLGIGKHEFFLPITGPISSTTPRWPSVREMKAFYESILPEMEQAADKVGVTIDFRPEFRSWKLTNQQAVEMVTRGLYNTHAGNPESRCLAPGWNLFITVNGNVYPCDMPSIISKDTALGNLDRHSLLEIINSKAMHEFAAGAGHYPACRMCVGRYEAVR